MEVTLPGHVLRLHEHMAGAGWGALEMREGVWKETSQDATVCFV